MDMNSLSHSKWNCKYHIVFAPKFRRKIAYGQLKQDIANILSMLCKRKGVKIVEAEICPDHVHMLVEIPPNISVSSFVGYLKGKSMFFAKMIWTMLQRLNGQCCKIDRMGATPPNPCKIKRSSTL